MRCRQQQQMLLRQLITESTLCSPRLRMQHKLLQANFPVWNINFRIVMSLSTSLHKFRANNVRITFSLHNNSHSYNHNHNHSRLLRAIRRIHRRTVHLIHCNNQLHNHLSSTRR